jgi:hypothetical protein
MVLCEKWHEKIATRFDLRLLRVAVARQGGEPHPSAPRSAPTGRPSAVRALEWNEIGGAVERRGIRARPAVGRESARHR